MSRRTKRVYKKCVYLIGFRSTHKVYVGSSSRWPDRIRAHRNELRQGKHSNSYLQNAYNKHGETDMVVEELEFFDDNLKMQYGEQKWMAYYLSTERAYGFNIVTDALRRGRTGCKLSQEQLVRQRESLAKARKEHPERFTDRNRGAPGRFVVYNPNGDRVEIVNLSRFCKENNLSDRRMRGVVRGSVVECEGWKLHPHRKNQWLKSYSLIGPNNERVEGICLNDFSRERGLPLRTMSEMLSGRVKVCRDWRRSDLPKEKAYTHRGSDKTLIDPNGQLVFINNLAAFCRKMNLKLDVVRKGYQSNGWRLKS